MSHTIKDSRATHVQRWLIVAVVFIAVLALYPLTPSPAEDAKVLGYQIVAFIALAVWVLSRRQAEPRTRPAKAFISLLTVFVLINLLASALSSNVGYSLAREMVKLSALFIIFLVTSESFRTPRQIWFLFSSICIAVAVASIYGVVQFLGLDPFPWGETRGMLREAPATFGNPNLASHVLVIATVLACGLATQRRGRWALLLLPLYLFHFSLTQTRGALLGLGVAAVVVAIAVFVSRRNASVRWCVTSTLLAVTAIAAVAVVAILVGTYIHRGELFPVDKSITLRYHSFYGACQMVQERPWVGFGPGMYEMYNPFYWTDFEQERTSRVDMMNFQVHNEPLQFAVEAGIFAAVLYVGIFILGTCYGLYVWFSARESALKYLGITLAAFFVAFFFDGFFGFNAHVPSSSVLLFVMAGTTIGALRENTSDVAEPIRPQRPDLFWRLAIVTCAAAIPVLGIRDFAAKHHQLRGLGALQQNVYPAAIESFQKASRLAPYDWLPRSYLGGAFMVSGNLEEAVEHLSRSLEMNPTGFKTRFRLAECLFNIAARSSGRDASVLDAAVQQAEYVAEIDPYYYEVHDLIGRANFLRAQWLSQSDRDVSAEEHWLAAEDELLQAIKLGAQKAKLYQIIGLARSARNDAVGAQAALILSLEEQPEDMETWRHLFGVSKQLNRFDSLLVMLDRRADQLQRSNDPPAEQLAGVSLLRAEAHYTRGDLAGANEAFAKAVDAFPSNLASWADYYAFATSAGYEDEFEASLVDAAKQDQSDVLDAAVAGLSNGENGILRGLSTLTNYLIQTQSSGQPPTHLAWAVEVLARRVGQHPISDKYIGPVYFMLGQAYGALDELEKAVQAFEHAETSLSGEELMVCLLEHGAVLTAADRTREAATVLKKASTVAPASFDARYAYANALAEDHQWAGAVLEYQTILASFGLDSAMRQRIQQQLEAAKSRLADRRTSNAES